MTGPDRPDEAVLGDSGRAGPLPGGPPASYQPAFRESEWWRRWDRFRRNRIALISLVFVVLLIVVAVAAPLIAPYPYDKPDYLNLLAPAFSKGHLFGTDDLGRDVLSRLLYSLRTALIVAFGAQFAALVFALLVGTVAGYRGGRLDQLLMGITDIMFAFPGYLFAVVMVTVMGRSTWAIILAIAITSWVEQARLVRAQVLKLSSQEYVEAGRAAGASGPTQVLRYILPNALGPILVATSFGIPSAMLAESGLALLGLGVAPPTPSWGSMIIDGYSQILSDPHLIIAPLTLFGLAMLAFTWIGDGVRDAFDVGRD